MTEALVRKLAAYAPLTDDDRQILQEVAGLPLRSVEARRDLAREGDTPRGVYLVCDGWVSRHKTLPDGRRQIVGLLVPGDLCDLNLYLLKERDHSLGAITNARVAEVPFAMVERLLQASPRIANALRMNELVVAATAHEWTLNVGQRSAYERIAHVMVEMYLRLERVGLARPDGIHWPLTQVDLADTVGLTPVHVNRTLQQLRRDGLILLSNKRLVVPDLQQLRRAAMFNPTYLHLDEPGPARVGVR